MPRGRLRGDHDSVYSGRVRLSALLCSAGLWVSLLPTGPLSHGALLSLLLAVTVGLLLTRKAGAATLPAVGRSAGPVPATGRPVRVMRAFDPDTAGRSRPRAPGAQSAPST